METEFSFFGGETKARFSIGGVQILNGIDQSKAKAQSALPGMNPAHYKHCMKKNLKRCVVMFRVSHSLVDGHFRIMSGPLTFRRLCIRLA